MVKNLPALQETQVQSLLDQEDPVEEGMATSNTPASRIPRTREPGKAPVPRVAQSQTRLKLLSSSSKLLVQ